MAATVTPAVNGEAREGVAVLRQRLDDCQRNEDRRWERNDAEHDEIFGRLRGVENEIGKQGVRVAVFAFVGSTIATSTVAAIIYALLGHIIVAGGGK